MTAAVCRQDRGLIVAHVHRVLQTNIPISQTFTARAFECMSIPLRSLSRQQFSGHSVACSCPALPLHPQTSLIRRHFQSTR